MLSFSAKGFSRLICCQLSGMYYVYNTFLTRHYQSFCTLKPHLFQYFSKCFVHFRLKNVMFDICPCEEVGDFEIKAKFLGVEMEKVQLHFQVSSQVHRGWHKAHAFIFFSFRNAGYYFYYLELHLWIQKCFSRLVFFIIRTCCSFSMKE